MPEMIARAAHTLLNSLAKRFPILMLTGPRQSGKTTLARHAFPRHAYVSLEDPDQRLIATQDPRGFLKRYEAGAIIDEAQHAPDLFSYLQTMVDATPTAGRFILTGSQNLSLTGSTSQSLAGRAAIVQLLPLSLAELRTSAFRPVSLDVLMFHGGYPAIHANQMDAAHWFSSYVATYLERDVRQLSSIQDLNIFQRFTRLCATRTGQILNLSAVASDCGVAFGTARAWLSILESSYLVFTLKPHFSNFGKRLVKAPKLYFHDTGLAAHLMGIENPDHLSVRPERPALFETLVVNEFLKRRFNQGLRSNLYYWRDNIGTEVDLILEEGAQLFPAEIKSGGTFQPESLRALQKWRGYAGESGTPALIYGGDDSFEFQGTQIISWRSL